MVEGLDSDLLRVLDLGQKKALVFRVLEETISRERVSAENHLGKRFH